MSPDGPAYIAESFLRTPTGLLLWQPAVQSHVQNQATVVVYPAAWHSALGSAWLQNPADGLQWPGWEGFQTPIPGHCLPSISFLFKLIKYILSTVTCRAL